MQRRNLLLMGCGAVLSAAAQQPMIGELIDLLTAYEPEPGDRWGKTRITTPAEWERRRADIRFRVFEVMGAPPPNNAPLSPRVTGEEDEGRYFRRKVVYTGSEGEPVPAWLLVPKGPGPFPAVLAAHPTQNCGKDSVIGLGGMPYEHYAKELAERGFVALAPDCITAGERVLPGSKPYVTEIFDRAHPSWSAMGKMLADHQRGIDYLQTLSFVKPNCIGAIGHSLGGYNAYFLGAFDDRVRAVVSSCGFTPIGRGTKPFAWCRPTWFVHFPRLAPYLRAGIVPFDIHEVMAMVAPRPLFNFSAGRDAIFPDAAAIREATGEVAAVYGVLGARDRFVFRMSDGPHQFPDAVKAEAYPWLERSLSTPS